MLPQHLITFFDDVQQQCKPSHVDSNVVNVYQDACKRLGIRPNKQLLRQLYPPIAQPLPSSSHDDEFSCKYAPQIAVNAETILGDERQALEELDLSCNYLGPLGCAALLPVLPHLQSLRTVSFMANGVSSEFVVALCFVLRTHPSIAAVSLAYNKLVALSASRALISLLRINRRIVEMTLEGTQVPAPVVQIITSLCDANRQHLQHEVTAVHVPSTAARADTGSHLVNASSSSSSPSNSASETGSCDSSHPSHSSRSSTPHSEISFSPCICRASPVPEASSTLQEYPFLNMLCLAAQAPNEVSPTFSFSSNETSSDNDEPAVIRSCHVCVIPKNMQNSSSPSSSTSVPSPIPTDLYSMKVMSSRHHHPLWKPNTGPSQKGLKTTCTYCNGVTSKVFTCTQCHIYMCTKCFMPLQYCGLPYWKTRVKAEDGPDMHSLYTAIRQGDRSKVNSILWPFQSILEKVANGLVEGVCFNYPTPLVYAAYYGRSEIAMDLLQSGAEPGARWLGLTAERWARNMGHHDTAVSIKRFCTVTTTTSSSSSSSSSSNSGYRVTNDESSLLRCGHDAMFYIFKFLPRTSLLAVHAVCSAWASIIESNHLRFLFLSLSVKNQPVDEVFVLTPKDLQLKVDYYGKSLWPDRPAWS